MNLSRGRGTKSHLSCRLLLRFFASALTNARRFFSSELPSLENADRDSIPGYLRFASRPTKQRYHRFLVFFSFVAILSVCIKGSDRVIDGRDKLDTSQLRQNCGAGQPHPLPPPTNPISSAIKEGERERESSRVVLSHDTLIRFRSNPSLASLGGSNRLPPPILCNRPIWNHGCTPRVTLPPFSLSILTLSTEIVIAEKYFSTIGSFFGFARSISTGEVAGEAKGDIALQRQRHERPITVLHSS